jgi:hypothetical protein
MVSVNFEAIDMEKKYYEILRHYVNPNDCATVVRQLLNLHNVSKKELKEKLQIEFDKGHYKGTQSTGYSF